MSERRPSANPARRRDPLRITLGVLLAFGALNAIGGATYGLRGAPGVPTEWLAGSPFGSYFIPSLILLVVVGGVFVAGAIAELTHRRNAALVALAAGVIVLGWIAVQVEIMGYRSWMQPATFGVGVAILLLALIQLRQTRRAP